MDALRSKIRDIYDFPKMGILFKDITPLLADAPSFKLAIDAMVAPWKDQRIAKVVGIESRGFIFASAMAYQLGAGLVIVRKPGKLPHKTIEEVYALEYGNDSLQLHDDAVTPGERVLIVDDLLATGGTASAVGRLMARQKAELVGYQFLIELGFLEGVKKLAPAAVKAVIRY
jgi:adenine phosphoribosyltransferase